MRFKDFLKEAKHRRDISVEKAVEILNEHCMDAIQHFDKPLWRGSMEMVKDAYLINGEDGGRASVNTSNFYTIIMDNFLPELGYPKRSKSIILVNNENESYVDGFGKRYAIFPYDDVKIGVCAEYDFWETNIPIHTAASAAVSDWNQEFRELWLSDSSYADFINSIKEKMKLFVTQAPDTPEHRRFTEIFGDDPDKVDAILKDAYSPKSLKTHLATAFDMEKYEDRRRELWLGGKCIALKFDTYNKMLSGWKSNGNL